MAAHDGLDRLACLVGVVERDGANVMVQDMSLDDAVEEVAPDEAHLSIDRCSSPASEGPGVWRIVGKTWVSMLEVGDGNYRNETSVCVRRAC